MASANSGENDYPDLYKTSVGEIELYEDSDNDINLTFVDNDAVQIFGATNYLTDESSDEELPLNNDDNIINDVDSDEEEDNFPL